MESHSENMKIGGWKPLTLCSTVPIFRAEDAKEAELSVMDCSVFNYNVI
jgi:hypothetical protein